MKHASISKWQILEWIHLIPASKKGLCKIPVAVALTTTHHMEKEVKETTKMEGKKRRGRKKRAAIKFKRPSNQKSSFSTGCLLGRVLNQCKSQKTGTVMKCWNEDVPSARQPKPAASPAPGLEEISQLATVRRVKRWSKVTCGHWNSARLRERKEHTLFD